MLFSKDFIVIYNVKFSIQFYQITNIIYICYVYNFWIF